MCPILFANSHYYIVSILISTENKTGLNSTATTSLSKTASSTFFKRKRVTTETPPENNPVLINKMIFIHLVELSDSDNNDASDTECYHQAGK